MNLTILVVFYGVLLYILLGGFLLTVCTDYPEQLRIHRNNLLHYRSYSYVTIVGVVMFWYVFGLGVWPYTVSKHRLR